MIIHMVFLFVAKIFYLLVICYSTNIYRKLTRMFIFCSFINCYFFFDYFFKFILGLKNQGEYVNFSQ
jgi:hypothetical protein